MNDLFPSDYDSIKQRIRSIDPVLYADSRNFTNGAVTRLSPYISRGVISLSEILRYLIHSGYDYPSCEILIKELAWREYFQRVWQHKNPDEDIRQSQTDVRHQDIPESILNASTGIEGIDAAIRELFETGYMHNHCRMYTASLICNIARYHWKTPALWMYYHLLDGDWASNACSWQWVAGSNSSKKYYASQENINKYTGKIQTGTFLDTSYDLLPFLPSPEHLTSGIPLVQKTKLPQTNFSEIQKGLPILIYNYYNLDPEWMNDVQANRILFFEKEIFEKFPVSSFCIDFVLSLAANIPGIRIFSGSLKELLELTQGEEIHYKEHPLNKHYPGIMHDRDWICPEVTGYHPSFSAFWKKAERLIKRNFESVQSLQTEINFSSNQIYGS
ncbi:MAG: FAD-binding domain-containing protein [Cyclobacteriaceae bacterium]